MRRVASLFLPQLAIERLRRAEPTPSPPEPARAPALPVDDDPGECSVPRGGHWRPGARWAQRDPAAVPLHQQPTPRELGRRSEAADPPFRARRGKGDAADTPAPSVIPALGRSDGGGATVLVAKVGRQEQVVAACPAARALGLAPGLAATQARALVPGLDVRPAEPARDAAWLHRLGLHAVGHWTPLAAPSGADGLWLELTGTAHLHGGEARFGARLVRFLARLGFTARVAVAGTPGAAHALARFGREPVAVLPPGGEAAALASLPLACLRWEAETLAVAARFGLERVADLLPVPRGPLVRRLGPSAVARLDQALGRVAEPVAGVVPPDVRQAERRLAEPIGTAEAIDTVGADLAVDLAERLREGGLGARALALALERIDGSEQRLALGLAKASRDPAHLARLLRLRTPSIDPGGGIETMRLVALRTEPLGAVAIAASLAGEAAAADVATLADMLAGRIGRRALFRATLVESDVPERAVRRVGPLAPVRGWPAWGRPARLLGRPEPVSGVIALLPDAPPRRFTWRGQVHDVAHADGPERIHGEWWVRDGETWACRDYYRVEDHAGGRFWLFRRGDGEDPGTGDHSWWLHGAG